MVSLAFPVVVVGICCKMVVVGESGVPVVVEAADSKINIRHAHNINHLDP